MFSKILIANRGEIARRIIIACRELGIATAAIYADPDANAPYVGMADERYHLPGTTVTDTYLNRAAIIDIAKQAGAQAIHPGYGFLSENAQFARDCAEAGLVFIGPSPDAIEKMGSKAESREIARQAGVPVVPGVDGAGMSVEALQTAVAGMPYPLLIKASAGGGGKGMRVVWEPAEFADAVRAARREAGSAFGDDRVLVERFFTAIHHVEIQVLADGHGQVLHLFERECSVQRRHQKIIEETPSPIIGGNEVLRKHMADAAVSLARAVGYTNAGTVEFIVTEDGEFYFLEMNTRLQVEHPITELVTGVDLAQWQIRVAAGEKLPFSQADLRQRGHAIECRVYAEDPAMGFLPSIGEIALWRPPAGPGVRVDSGIETGTAVTPYYDPMMAKIITWGANRQEAVAKMVRALRDTVALGVTTNIPYLLDILQENHFLQGQTPTSYLDQHFAGWQPSYLPTETDWLAAAANELLGQQAAGSGAAAVGESAQPDPWQMGNGWRNLRP